MALFFAINKSDFMLFIQVLNIFKDFYNFIVAFICVVQLIDFLTSKKELSEKCFV